MHEHAPVHSTGQKPPGLQRKPLPLNHKAIIVQPVQQVQQVQPPGLQRKPLPLNHKAIIVQPVQQVQQVQPLIDKTIDRRLYSEPQQAKYDRFLHKDHKDPRSLAIHSKIESITPQHRDSHGDHNKYVQSRHTSAKISPSHERGSQINYLESPKHARTPQGQSKHMQPDNYTDTHPNLAKAPANKIPYGHDNSSAHHALSYHGHQLIPLESSQYGAIVAKAKSQSRPESITHPHLDAHVDHPKYVQGRHTSAKTFSSHERGSQINYLESPKHARTPQGQSKRMQPDTDRHRNSAKAPAEKNPNRHDISSANHAPHLGQSQSNHAIVNESNPLPEQEYMYHFPLKHLIRDLSILTPSDQLNHVNSAHDLQTEVVRASHDDSGSSTGRSSRTQTPVIHASYASANLPRPWKDTERDSATHTHESAEGAYNPTSEPPGRTDNSNYEPSGETYYPTYENPRGPHHSDAPVSPLSP